MASLHEAAPAPPVRLGDEICHGQRIAARADDIWGWTLPTAPSRARRRTDLLVRYGRIGPEKTVLELGCGTGVITKQLARSGAEVVALDLSPDLLATARARRMPANVAFQIGDAEALDFPGGTFDAVVGSSILHHLNLDRVLPEVHRVLRPGGSIAFSEPNMMNPQIFVQKSVPWIKRLAGDTPDETAFVRWPLSDRLKQTGFQEVEIVPYDFLHPSVPFPLISPISHLGRILERIPLVREIAGSLIIGAVRSKSC